MGTTASSSVVSLLKYRPGRRTLSMALLSALFLLTLDTTPANVGEAAVGGQVLAPGGHPLPEARVRLLPLTSEAEALRRGLDGRPVEAAVTTATDAEGRFLVVAPHAGLWRLRIDGPGLVPTVFDLRPLIESLELPPVELAHDAGIVVRALDVAGKGIPGARVVVSDDVSAFRADQGWKAPLEVAVTGADGSVRLPKAETNPVAISASAPERPVASLRGVRGTAASLRLAVGTARTVQVNDAAGAPLPDVLVTIGSRAHPYGLTGSDGKLRVAAAAGEEPVIRLAATDGRELTSRLSAPVAGQADRVVLVLPDRSVVAGKLIDATSRQPIAGGVVWDANEPTAGAVSDRSGAFALFGPAGRRLELTAGAPGYLPASPVAFSLDGSGRPGPALVLRPAAAIAGVVADSSGQPVSAAEIEVEVRRTPGEFEIRMGNEAPAPRARSSSSGSYRLGPLDPDSRYTVRVRSAGFPPAEKAVSGLEAYRTTGGVDVVLSRGQTVHGRVADGEGSPLREVVVAATPGSSAGGIGAIRMMQAGPAPEPVRATSGDDGRFRLAGLPAGKLDLTFTRAGFARGELSNVEVPAEGQPVDVGEIVMRPGESLQGYVLESKGTPLEGVEVRVSDSQGPAIMMLPGPEVDAGPDEPDALTDSTGWFAVGDLAASGRYTLSFQRRGYVNTSKPSIELPSREPLTVTMEPASQVSGTVLDPAGDPVPGASVRLQRSQTMEMGGSVMQMVMMIGATADAAGRFLFEDQEPGKIALIASASGFQEAKLDHVEVPKGEDLEGVEIPLPRGAILEGRVNGPDGQAAIGARVRVVEERQGMMMDFGGLDADGNGFYRLEGLAAGPLSVEATHPDFPRTVRDVELDEGLNALDLQFEGGVEVSGRVTDVAGAPVADARVRLAPVARQFGGPETRTRPDGTFLLPGVQAGEYSARVEAEGHAASAGRPVSVGADPVGQIELTLERGTRIVGRVSGIDPGQFRNVRVEAEGAVFRGFQGEAVDHEGNYRLEHLAPGTWQIVATLGDSGRRAQAEILVESGNEELRVDLQFESGLTLSGRAVRGGEPVVGATLMVEGIDVDSSGWGETGLDGEFSIDGLMRGSYQLRLRNWQTGLAYNESLELGTSRELLVEIPTAQVVGRIVDAADREPLAGVTLTLESESEFQGRLPTHTATTDVEGRFVVESVGDGAWRLSARRKGYAAVAREVAVHGGKSAAELRLEMEPTEGMLLEARLPSGAIPTDLRVAVLDSSGVALVSGTYDTGEGGRVRLSSVPRGSWRVVVSAGGAATMAFDAQAPGPAVPVALALPTTLVLAVEALVGSSVLATVRIADEAGRPFVALGWDSRPQTEWRMSGGRMTVQSLPPGVWQVQVQTSDGKSWGGSVTTSVDRPAELLLE